MSNISGPPPSHDPYENIRVSSVEGDPSKQEEKETEKNKKNKSKVVFAHFLDKLEKIAAFFLRYPGEFVNKHTITEHSLDHSLKQLLQALQKLKREDYSQDVLYLNKVSSWWHHFLEDAGKIRNHAKFYAALENFIEKIHSYPENAEHSLGYYLLEYAGAEWIPFPFMDMLQDLHLEHKQNPIQSHLAKWTRILEELIEKMGREI